LGMYLAIAEEQGVTWDKVSGTNSKRRLEGNHLRGSTSILPNPP